MGYGTFTVIAGPFSTAAEAQSIAGRGLRLRSARDRRMGLGLVQLPKFEKLPTTAIASVEVAHEETAKSFAGSAAAGIAGALLLGPVGALAGALSGGNRSLVTFVLTLADGRRALCTAKSPTFRLLQAAAFEAANPTDAEPPTPLKITLARWAIMFAVVGGLAAGGIWWLLAPQREMERARYDATLSQMRSNFPKLSEAELRARVDAHLR